ncbi:MAG TPA: hypothetical protein VLE89_05015 [Chlamydiales bacterium]|nr:hypothetical protein [Chlamydiales bacterium]
MSAVPAASVHVPIAPTAPDIPNVPSPPCSGTVCGRRVTCVDGVAVVVEAGSTIGCIVSALEGSALAAASWGTSGGLCLIAHIVWRKYGDVDAITKRLQAASQAMKQTIERYTKSNEELSKNIEAVQKQNDQLQKENEDFGVQNKQLQKTVAEIQQGLEQFKKTNVELAQINGELKGQIEQLTKTNQDLQARVQEFKTHLGSFKTEIQKVGALIPSLQNTDKALDHSVATLDKEFDQDLDQFEKQINEIQASFKQIFETLQKENEDLKAQVSGLDQEGDELRASLQALQAEMMQLKDIYENTNKELQGIKGQLGPQVAALKEEEKALASLVQGLDKGNTSLHTTVQSLEQLRQEFSALNTEQAAEIQRTEALRKKIENS